VSEQICFERDLRGSAVKAVAATVHALFAAQPTATSVCSSYPEQTLIGQKKKIADMWNT
jgi:hypothetical protein